MKSVDAIRFVVLSFGLAFGFASVPAHAQTCPGDVNGDGVVNGVDLAYVLTDWGTCVEPGPVVTSVTPSFGPPVGGTAITIAGSNFSAVTGVMLAPQQRRMSSSSPTV